MRAADLTDEMLLVRLADYSAAFLNSGGWVTADLLQRSFRGRVYDLDAPSVAMIGRRLSRLAREGRCEKRTDDGIGAYRIPE